MSISDFRNYDTFLYIFNYKVDVEIANWLHIMVQNSTFMRKIYKGFDTRHNIEPTMWREILRIINEATVDGLSQGKVPVHEDDFLSSF